MSAVLKTCGCGRRYSRAEWGALPCVGVSFSPADAEGPAEHLEYRNCSCGSTIAIVVRWRVHRYAPEIGRNGDAVRSDGERPSRLVRDYGLFDDREVADRVALRAIEKHMGDLVVVVPEEVSGEFRGV